MAYKISDIPTHSSAPASTYKIELENPTGPQSVWSTISEILTTNLPRKVLASDLNLYVRTDGSDSNIGTLNSPGGAFLTPQKAIDVAATNYDMGVWDIKINLVNTSFPSIFSVGTGLIARQCLGSGRVRLIGEVGSPDNVVIDCNTSGGTCLWSAGISTVYYIDGVTLTATGGASTCFALRAEPSSIIEFCRIRVGGFLQAFRSADGGEIRNNNTTAAATIEVIGDSTTLWASVGGNLRCQTTTITFTPIGGTRAITDYIAINLGANAIMNGNTFSGVFTGRCYNLAQNATLNNSSSTIPGSIVGTTDGSCFVYGTSSTYDAQWGVGTGAPNAALCVYPGTPPTAPTGTVAYIGGVDNTNTFLVGDAYQAGAGSVHADFMARHARGTKASPTATQSGDNVGQIQGRGYGATGFAAAARAALVFVATENWTDTAQGLKPSLWYTPIGTAAAVKGLEVNDSGLLVPAGVYHNFGTTSGSAGYGLRDNAGVVEKKDSGGAWSAVVTATWTGTLTVTGIITSNGSSGAFNIHRRDTSADAYYLYSQAGNLQLYDTVKAVDVWGIEQNTGNQFSLASSYHNWGATLGSTGYGMRDNSGAMQFKNSGGAGWRPFDSALSLRETLGFAANVFTMASSLTAADKIDDVVFVFTGVSNTIGATTLDIQWSTDGSAFTSIGTIGSGNAWASSNFRISLKGLLSGQLTGFNTFVNGGAVRRTAASGSVATVEDTAGAQVIRFKFAFSGGTGSGTCKLYTPGGL